jgi:nucleotide-binding universal stress UspA family protein
VGSVDDQAFNIAVISGLLPESASGPLPATRRAPRARHPPALRRAPDGGPLGHAILSVPFHPSEPPRRHHTMILIAYDGSDDAKAAIEQAATLVSGQPAVVVTVWEPYAELITRYPAAGGLMAGDDAGEIDDASRNAADETAEEGAALARTHGIEATAHGVAREASIVETLLGEADRANASAIVVGSRGLGGLGSLLLGSVSHALLQHADRTVVIVPSPKVARRRDEKRRAGDAADA